MESGLLAALIIALTAVPMLVIAIGIRKGNLGLINGLDPERVRDPDALARRLSTWMLLMAVALLLAGVGYWWAGAVESRVIGVTIALVIAINVLALRLVFSVAAAKRDYKPLPRQ
ncbi:MAG: hypothetical protein Q4F49_01770 [Pseudoxanthomonas suwonensis]|nr:hypothetical protein [Pseudoxanthomonas suwonensis]